MEFEYNGKTFTYHIERKKMKNIRVRVMEDGSIHVSAPHAVPESYIRSFLLENADELAGIIDRVHARNAAAPDYSDGSTVLWLGKPVTLHLYDTPRPSVLTDDVLHIFARSPQEAKAAVRQWMITECLALYKEINREVHAAFHRKGYNVPLAHIQIKEMVSRWGSCTASTGRLSINFRLLQYPKECIYGVFFHEYAHFLHQDHSEAFYRVLLEVYPEYRRWDAVLKKPLA